MTAEFMINAKGHQVPVSIIRDQEKLENDVVMDLITRANYHSGLLGGFKCAAFADVNAFMELLNEKYDVKKGGKKGNVTLTSFDGLFKVVVAQQEFIDFGPELQVAKSIIDDCIRSWSENANQFLRVIVEAAFKVDKNNRLNTQSILGLRSHKIDDPLWNKAMNAISESMRVRASKTYIRFYQRPTPESDWKSIVLDIAGA